MIASIWRLVSWPQVTALTKTTWRISCCDEEPIRIITFNDRPRKNCLINLRPHFVRSVSVLLTDWIWKHNSNLKKKYLVQNLQHVEFFLSFSGWKWWNESLVKDLMFSYFFKVNRPEWIKTYLLPHVSASPAAVRRLPRSTKVWCNIQLMLSHVFSPASFWSVFFHPSVSSQWQSEMSPGVLSYFYSWIRVEIFFPFYVYDHCRHTGDVRPILYLSRRDEVCWRGRC